MKTKSLVILTFILCFHSYGQKNDLFKLNLKGNIKNIRETYYQINKNDAKIQDTSIDFSYLNTFDKQGNKKEDLKYDAEGKMDKKYEYIYDKLGRRIIQDQYNSDGKLNRKLTYKYDEKGNITEDNSYTSEGKLEKKYTYQYDAKGNVTEDKSFDSENKFRKKYTYSYDASGNKIENNRYNAEGMPDKRVIYKYDDKGNVIEEIQTANDGEKTVYVYEYKYDIRQNWIQKNSFREKNIVSIIKREIGYY